jgi:hypothetical protein
MKTLFYLILFLFTSCVALRPLENQSGNLSESNFKRLNGLYQAQPDSAYKANLADLLIVNYYLNYPSKKIDTFYDTLEVEIKAVSPHKIEITVFRNKIQESRRTLKGKLKNGYFLIKQQYQYDSELPIVLGTSTRQKSRLTIDKAGNVLVDAKEMTNVRFLLVPLFFQTDQYFNREFKKIQTLSNTK